MRELALVRAMKITDVSLRRKTGASPSDDLYYVLVLFDISNAKRYRCLTKLLMRYGSRIQKSVFEAWLTKLQISNLKSGITKVTSSFPVEDDSDSIRVYVLSGPSSAVVFGSYEDTYLEDNIFL